MKLNFENYEPVFYSEEARICDYLTELNNLIPAYEYMVFFKALVTNDKKLLADAITATVKVLGKKEEDIRQYKKEIEYYRKQIEELKEQIAGLRNEREFFPSKKLEELKRMKALYEQGHSLREIAKSLGHDKSTIKRNLIKIGVHIRP